MACIGYLQAMLDINNLERQNGTHVQWCAPEIIKLEDLRLIIIRKLKAEPDKLTLPFVTLATNALVSASETWRAQPIYRVTSGSEA